MNPRLKALPIDQLFALKQEIDEAVAMRRYELFKVGRLATFEKAGRGINGVVTIRIKKLGPTNVYGEEVNERGNPTGQKWRCHPNTLTPVFEKPKPPVAPKGAGADAPQSELAGSF